MASISNEGSNFGMNVAICDDEIREMSRLEEMIHALDRKIKVYTFSAPEQFLTFIKDHPDIDLCFMDIIMDTMNGIELSKKLRDMDIQTKIVLLSTSKKFGPESYQINAFGYYEKPIKPDELQKVLRSIEELSNERDNKKILIKNRNESLVVHLRDVSFVEVASNDVFFHLKNGNRHRMRMTMTEAMELLSNDERFARCHRSYAVNFNEVASVQDTRFLLRSGKLLPISPHFIESKTRYIKWMLKG